MLQGFSCPRVLSQYPHGCSVQAGDLSQLDRNFKRPPYLTSYSRCSDTCSPWLCYHVRALTQHLPQSLPLLKTGCITPQGYRLYLH
jgi:hypothetical protein